MIRLTAGTIRKVAAANKATTALNTRITTVLGSGSGEDLGSEPRAWWDWWANYNDYEQPEERQKLDEGYRRDVQRLHEERDSKIEKVRHAR